jgi:hypothetical protein
MEVDDYIYPSTPSWGCVGVCDTYSTSCPLVRSALTSVVVAVLILLLKLVFFCSVVSTDGQDVHTHPIS